MTAVIIEIITRGRGQPQYRRVRTFPYSIGRAYDNDLVLHDETVSAHHLQLEQDADGNLLVRNLSHENGSELDRRKLGFVPELLQLPASLALGHTTLKMLAPGTAVAPTRRHVQYPGPIQMAGQLPFALLLLALVQLLNWVALSEASLGRHSSNEVLLQQLPQMVSPLILATFTGFISRILLHRWQFALQLSIACIGMLALDGSVELQQRIAYYYSSDKAAQWLSIAFSGTILTLIFAWQLRAFSSLSQARALLTATAISWSFLMMMFLQSWVRTPEFTDQPDMQISLRPADIRAKPTLELPDFIDAVETDLDVPEPDEKNILE